jgi:hypothetical protein
MFCAVQNLPTMGIQLRKVTGVFWGQCLERGIDQALADDADVILTIDYDTVFTAEQVEELLRLLRENPEVDAIAPVQVSRYQNYPLVTIKDDNGDNVKHPKRALFEPDLCKVATAHFGLTVIRADSLKKLPRPWFNGVPSDDGSWQEGRIDDDIWFWQQMERAGMEVRLANRVTIGHCEMMVLWPDQDFHLTTQHPVDFWKNGAPENVWR